MNYGNLENWRCKMLNTKRIILIICVLASLNNEETKAQVLSIDHIIQRIDQENELLKSYGLKAEGYKYKAEAATAWMAPMVGVGTYMTPYPGATTMSSSEKGSFMFQFEQEIPGRAKRLAKRRSINSLTDIEHANRAEVFNDLKAQSRQLYNSWLITKQRIEILEKNKQILETMKKVEELRYTFNQSNLGGIYKLDAKIEENKNKIRMQEGMIAKTRSFLNALMNQSEDFQFDIDSAYMPVFQPEVAIDTSDLSSSRADIQRMNKNIHSMQLEIESMKLQKRPDLKIRFDHMSPLANGGMPNSYSVMGMISIPIAPWSAKMYKSDIKAMQYDIQAMEKTKVGMLQESHGRLYGIQYQLQSKEQQIAAFEEKVIPALQKAFDAYYINYQENKLQLPVLIDSWESLNMMELNVLDEKLELYQMIVEYEKELYR